MPTRIFIILTCCLLAAAVSAQNRGGGAQGRRPDSAATSRDSRNDHQATVKWWTDDKIKRELGLTARQVEKLEAAFEVSMSRLRVDKPEMDRKQAKFSELLARPSAPEQDLLQAAAELDLARYNVNRERTTMLVRMHIVLTPDQRKGLEAIRKRNEADKTQSR
jgi:Spy/CpxP family protein refolding chaperone